MALYWMPQVIGRKGKARRRTVDASLGDTTFATLFLRKETKEGLQKAGFLKPSPIQLAAIPVGLLGSDIIGQAKSGTGKTLVFSIIATEVVDRRRIQPQVLILAPTREIAEQIQQVIRSISSLFTPPLFCNLFIGGIPLSVDSKALRMGTHVAVGTPGRVRELITNGSLSCSAIRLFVADEADKLLDGGFDEQFNDIYHSLPHLKQCLALSATYTAHSLKKLEKIMKSPRKVFVSEDRPTLEGVKQYYCLIKEEEGEGVPKGSAIVRRYEIFKKKAKRLLALLSTLRFHQCLVFCNQQDLAQKFCNTLGKHGWENRFISGRHDQGERQDAMAALRSFSLRVLVSTDLTARGVDVEKVNLVMNLDLPFDAETYMHRIGRTGRFGTYGVAISFVDDAELQTLQKIQMTYSSSIQPLPNDIPPHFYAYHLQNEKDETQLQQMENDRKEMLQKPHKKKQKLK